MILPTLWIFTAHTQATWSLSVFSKNFNVPPNSRLNIPISAYQLQEDEELFHSRFSLTRLYIENSKTAFES